MTINYVMSANEEGLDETTDTDDSYPNAYAKIRMHCKIVSHNVTI